MDGLQEPVTQTPPEEGRSGLSGADGLRVAAVTLGVGGLSALALLALGFRILGQALGGTLQVIAGGSGGRQPSGGVVLAVVLLVCAGQAGLSWLAASRIVAPARRRAAGRLSLGISLLLCAGAAAGSGFVARAATADRQRMEHLLRERLEERLRAEQKAAAERAARLQQAERDERREQELQQQRTQEQVRRAMEEAQRDMRRVRRAHPFIPRKSGQTPL